MSWWAALPGLVLLAALWVLPGYALLRGMGVRGLLAFGAGAGVTTALAGTYGVLFDRFGIPWNLGTFLLGCVLAIAVALGLGIWWGTIRDPGAEQVSGARRTWAERGWLGGTWTIGGLALILPMMVGMSRADMPLQAWDAVFHYNAAWYIQDTGNGSLVGGLSPMYAETMAPYYPSVWHSIVAIAPGFERVTEAANSSSLIIGGVIWIAGLVSLARVVWQGDQHRHGWLAVVLVPIIAATYVGFPTVAMTMLGTWPFALSTACVPGTLALLIVALRGNQSWQSHTVHAIGAAASALGVVVAHGSGLFSLMLLAAPLALVLLGRQARRAVRAGHRVLVAVAAVAVAVALVFFVRWLLVFPPLQAIVAYERGGSPSYWGPIGSILVDQPLIYAYDFLSVNVVVTGLVAVGVGVAIARKQARWLVLGLAAAGVLVLLAAGPPESSLRPLAGFWYTQPSRIYQIFLIPAIILAAGGTAWVISALARKLSGAGGAEPAEAGDGPEQSTERRRDPAPAAAPTASRESLVLPAVTVAVIVVLGLVTFGFRWPTHVEVTRSIYNNWPIAWGTMLEKEEIDLVDRARDTLPDDAVVLGEPVNGSSFLLARADVEVIFPHLSPIPRSPERMLLMDRFNQWQIDPEVCEAVRALGITHIYTDELTFEEGAKWESTTPGLREARPFPEEAFEYVDSGGKASLWRFTGCDLP